MGGRLSGSSHFITQPRAAVGRARRRAGLGSPRQVTLSACPGPARLHRRNIPESPPLQTSDAAVPDSALSQGRAARQALQHQRKAEGSAGPHSHDQEALDAGAGLAPGPLLSVLSGDAAQPAGKDLRASASQACEGTLTFYSP